MRLVIQQAAKRGAFGWLDYHVMTGTPHQATAEVARLILLFPGHYFRVKP